MKFKRVCLCYFSPTGATRKIVSEIAAGIGIDPLKVIENNLTYPEYADSIIEIEPEDLVVVAAPVYAGMLPAVALQRLGTIKFANNPVVLVAVYGNRNYDDALIDLREFASAAGLLPVAAAAFVGEHSYSNDKYKIAKGRPDADDMQIARDFGRKVYEKIQSLSPKAEMPELKLPGTFPLPERKNINHTAVETKHEICVECGRCQEVCPTGAVYYKKGYQTNKDLCILCFACVKKCPQQARIAASETMQQFREKLSAMPRRAPEIFI